MNFSRFNKKLLWLLLPILVIIIVVVVVVCVLVLRDETVEVSETNTNLEVTISQGTLRGVDLVSRSGRSIFGFKGIPFAEPPVGELRFAAPVAPSPWDGTLDASSDTDDCVQSGSGVEDCLYLNVYTPQLPTSEDSELLPVMVFIHGGGFRGGGNDEMMTSPGYLLDKDVVLVVPSYRLGIFGFLSTADEVVPGNNGLKDLVMALEWNRDNIQYFGGDPNRVTIFGQSAGGMLTQLLALSNSTDGLIHRYISQSGSALTYDAHRPRAVLADRTIQVGEYVGCPTNTSTDLVNCLRGVDTSLLLDSDEIFQIWNNRTMVIWSPTAEPDVEGAFLTENPANVLDAGAIRDLAWLCTVNKDEEYNTALGLAADADTFSYFLNNLDITLPPWLTYDTRVENVTAYTEALRSFYLNDLTADSDVLVRNLSNLFLDGLFAYPTYSANQKLLAYATQPQFLGSFDYWGTTQGSMNDGETPVVHGDDLIYLFPSASSAQMNETDWEMVDIMVDLWTSFAANGTPSTVWDRYSSLNNYLRIGGAFDTSLEVQYNYLEERMQFWDELTAATTWL